MIISSTELLNILGGSTQSVGIHVCRFGPMLASRRQKTHHEPPSGAVTDITDPRSFINRTFKKFYWERVFVAVSLVLYYTVKTPVLNKHQTGFIQVQSGMVSI